MENFKQLCVIHGLIIGAENVSDFEKVILDNTGCRIKYSEEVLTNPDVDESGNAVPETGGRNDVLFFIHDEDVMKFAIPRLQLGIRWWEDVIKYNSNSYLYSKEILEKYSPTW